MEKTSLVLALSLMLIGMAAISPDSMAAGSAPESSGTFDPDGSGRAPVDSPAVFYHTLIQGTSTDWSNFISSMGGLAGRWLDVEVAYFGADNRYSAIFCEDGDDYGYATCE